MAKLPEPHQPVGEFLPPPLGGDRKDVVSLLCFNPIVLDSPSPIPPTKTSPPALRYALSGTQDKHFFTEHIRYLDRDRRALFRFDDILSFHKIILPLRDICQCDIEYVAIIV